MNKLSVVIPCYNEEVSIKGVIASLPKGVDEIVVVDNNSTDRTAEIAASLGAVVILEQRQGYGYAMKTGIMNARGDYIVTLDGDGQYPADKIIPILSELQRNKLDFISANRFPLEQKSMSFTRIFGNWFLTFWTNIIFGLKLKDSQSGMWIFKRDVLSQIKLVSNDMPVSEEIKIRVAKHPHLTFAEYHIPYHPRGGVSKLSPIKHGFKNLFFLIKLRLEFLSRKTL